MACLRSVCEKGTPYTWASVIKDLNQRQLFGTLVSDLIWFGDRLANQPPILVSCNFALVCDLMFKRLGETVHDQLQMMKVDPKLSIGGRVGVTE